MKDDTVSRASVLKAIDEYERLSMVSQTVRNMTSLREIVQWLPAVQTCEDAVSRADVLETYADLYDVFEDSRAICKELHKVYDRINALPAVQPQRTCVNCGRTVNNGGWYADGKTRCPIEEHYALPKDGYCHLWEKRNVTDDDYPERRIDE